MKYEPSREIVQKLLNDYDSKNYLELINITSKLRKSYPKSIFLLNLQGATHNQLNNLEDAIKCFNQIIKLNKKFADAYYNLGILYKKINKIEKSKNFYKECIDINPKKFEAFNNLGNIYKDEGDIKKALDKYTECLEINPNYLLALQNFGVCLQNFNFSYKTKIIDRQIINLIKKDKILRPVDIINNLINYLYLDNEFKKTVDSFNDLKKTVSVEKLVDKILRFEILMNLLVVTPITDLQTEKLLIYLRKNTLLNLDFIKDKENSFKFIKLLAKQCFINEYIYPIESHELKILNDIENKILNCSKENNYNEYSFEIACIASYKSLNNYSWSKNILNLKNISGLVKQQIQEPAEEILLKEKILSKKIKNDISVKVKNQYENNPYPRWTKIALVNEPDEILDFANSKKLKVNNLEIEKWKKINVLVAGCGTGQHAITTATKYRNSFVTAIDLSSQSLCYAKRKADDLGIKNISFIEMDILDLKFFKKSFEIIESVGVLHHMKNPLVGWKILSDILKPGGLIMIGLYSKLARKHITNIRSKVKKNNKEIKNEDIKLFRKKIIRSKNEKYELIKKSPDFYSLSSLIDLIFHVQEHTFTIPEIKMNIDKLGLAFCGFDGKENLKAFQKNYTDIQDLYNLDCWNQFEKKNPRNFAGMYQFWCQKMSKF